MVGAKGSFSINPCTSPNSSFTNKSSIVINPKVITVKPLSSDICQKYSLSIIRSNILGYYDISVPKEVKVDDYIKELSMTNDFESIEYNYLSYIESEFEFEICNNKKPFIRFTPNDTLLYEQWYLEKINVYDAWDITKGSPNIKVAVISTGVESTHEDIGLGSDSYTNIDVTLGNNLSPITWPHGTIIAGMISAKSNNITGIAGIAGGNNGQGAIIIPYNACDNITGDSINWSVVDDYILDAVDSGAKIIIIGHDLPNDNQALSNAIDYAYYHDVCVIGETGMYGGDTYQKPVAYPAAYDHVIAVGSTQYYTHSIPLWASYSGYGDGIDLVAPGTYIYSTTPNNSYKGWVYHTGFAAAQVAGAVALVLSVNPSLPSDDIQTILRNTANKIDNYTYNNGWNEFVGYGQLNTFLAVDSAEHYISIIGNKLLCTSNSYFINNLPIGATVTWTLSGSNASKFNLVQNSPSANKCTITKKSNSVFSSSSFTLTLTANIYQGGTLIKTKTKTLTCNNGFTCTYWQDAHEYYGVNYPAITQTQMTSATNYVYPGGIVFLQSEYFRGKVITTSGIFDNFQHVGQNIVKLSLPPYSSSPAYINVEADGCDEALQLTFYPMSYYSMGSYSATLSVVSEQEYRISLVRNEEVSAEDTVDTTRTTAENPEADGKVSWTVEAVNALTGRKVLSTEPEGTAYVLSTAGWESGLYILRIIVGGEVVATQKIHVS